MVQEEFEVINSNYWNIDDIIVETWICRIRIRLNPLALITHYSLTCTLSIRRCAISSLR